jgi:aspartate carbamoyltransferase catalytic subunit
MYETLRAPPPAPWGFGAPGGHLLTAGGLQPEFADALCARAAALAAGEARPAAHAGRAVALLFFQPSTRTRLGFEVATAALGAQPVGMDDMEMSRSNARSGESLEDCAAVVSRLCDGIVLRHHLAGAAARMAAVARCPVINAGDGWGEHPTQALIDLFALRRGLGELRGRTLGFVGDPRARTLRSLLLLLRHEPLAEIVLCPSQPLPADALAALEGRPVRMVDHVDAALRACEALVVSPYDVSDIGERRDSGYLSPRHTPDAYRVTAEAIARAGSSALLYHPLPRHDEIDPDCDALPQAMYFEQVRLSRYMRVAILERALAAP